MIATGIQYSVREFVEIAAQELGITLQWDGRGVEETGTVGKVTGEKAPALKTGDRIIGTYMDQMIISIQ